MKLLRQVRIIAQQQTLSPKKLMAVIQLPAYIPVLVIPNQMLVAAVNLSRNKLTPIKNRINLPVINLGSLKILAGIQNLTQIIVKNSRPRKIISLQNFRQGLLQIGNGKGIITIPKLGNSPAFQEIRMLKRKISVSPAQGSGQFPSQSGARSYQNDADNGASPPADEANSGTPSCNYTARSHAES